MERESEERKFFANMNYDMIQSFPHIHASIKALVDSKNMPWFADPGPNLGRGIPAFGVVVNGKFTGDSTSLDPCDGVVEILHLPWQVLFTGGPTKEALRTIPGLIMEWIADGRPEVDHTDFIPYAFLEPSRVYVPAVNVGGYPRMSIRLATRVVMNMWINTITALEAWHPVRLEVGDISVTKVDCFSQFL